MPCRAYFRIFAIAVLGTFLAAGFSTDVRAEDEPAKQLTPAEEAAAGEFFEKKVRPILVARCFECHGSDTAEAKGGLRLHTRAASLKGGDTGPAIIPGNVEKSLLVDAINYGEVYQMPPRNKMPADEIQVLTTWVKQGAYWPQQANEEKGESKDAFDLEARKNSHWCWQPLKSMAPPAVKTAGWARDPMDQFILAKLEEAGLAPLPEASRATLLRRASFDLIGLPPTPQQVQAFVADSSPQAFEKVVDQLLESPHFGERFARHWMDLVRYAESRGHEFDYTVPNAHQYRDYLIRAFNQDVPYDVLAREHIAGDLMAKPRMNPKEGFNESILGTGFWFFGEWVHSPVDIRKDETDRFDNMLDVFSKTFLGLTVACARCHDHKFDAISQKDYYALAGYLQSASYHQARFDTQQQHEQVAAAIAQEDAAFRKELAKWLVAKLRPQSQALAERIAAEGGQKVATEQWEFPADSAEAQVVLDPSSTDPTKQLVYRDGPTFEAVPPGQIVLPNERDPAAALALPSLATVGSYRRDTLWNGLSVVAGSEDENGKIAGWGRAGRTLKTRTITLRSGRLHYLVRGSGHAYAAIDSHIVILGPLHNQIAIDMGGDSKTPVRWVSQDLQPYKGHNCHVELLPRGNEDFEVLAVVDAPQAPQKVTRPNALAAVDAKGALTKEQVSAAIETILGKIEGLTPLTLEETTLANVLVSHAFPKDGTPEWPTELKKLREGYVASRQKHLTGVKMDSRLAMTLWEGSPQNEHLLIRGNNKTVGPEIPMSFLAALTPAEGTASKGRLELANQVTGPQNPLFARVAVNRLWHHLLGRGIVPSCDNMGVLGQPPSHPELLDHLATRFMQEGYSIKRMVRAIVLSGVYRQAASVEGVAVALSPDQQAVLKAQLAKGDELDPENILLHHASVRRLQGEVIRDSILAVSGRLDEKAFGPSVPVNLSAFMQGRGRPADGPLDGNGRRSLYISIRRNFLSPMMLAFDSPIPFSTMGRRNVSNVPAQALILLNDPFVVGQARLWAEKVLKELPAATPNERIENLYQTAFGRSVTPDELAIAGQFLQQQGEEYKLSASDRVNDVRVWTDLCHALINTKEFIYLQ